MLQRRISPAKKYLRRTLQVVALVFTLLIGIVALAVIVSQTPWFKDWLRRFVVRESKQYLNGNLSIGSLGGNLFYGVQLGDVSIDVNGEHVVTLKRLEIKYNVAELVSSGTVQQIRLEQPFILLRHDANGWNVARDRASRWRCRTSRSSTAARSSTTGCPRTRIACPLEWRA